MGDLSPRKIVVFGILVILLVFSASWTLTILRSAAADKAQKSFAVPLTPTWPWSSEPRSSQAQAVAEENVEEQARIRRDLLEAETFVRDASKELDALERKLTEWATRVTTLLADETGRRIASSQVTLEQFAALQGQERLSSEDLDRLRLRLDGLRGPIEEASRNETPNYSPSGELLADVQKIEDEAAKEGKTYDHHLLILKTNIDAAALAAPAEQTLGQSLEERRLAVAEAEANALREALKTAEAERLELIVRASREATLTKADAEAEAIRIIGKEQAIAIRTAANETAARIKADLEEQQRRAEEERLKRLAEDPAVQRRYAAFLQPGYLQFTASPRGLLKRSERPQAVSLGDLDRNGWLANVETFARGMTRKPNLDYNAFNDRPTRPMPRTQAEWAEMVRLFEDFKKLAPFWVEQELLRP